MKKLQKSTGTRARSVGTSETVAGEGVFSDWDAILLCFVRVTGQKASINDIFRGVSA
jgi:hypothetical protein